MRAGSGLAPYLLPVVAGLLAQGGCLVQSECAADYDCAADERCGSGKCFVECRTDQDCYLNGAYFGKHCVQNRCEFHFDERVLAPPFCLRAVNPKSSAFEKEWCLSSSKGRVTLLYFGWLT